MSTFREINASPLGVDSLYKWLDYWSDGDLEGLARRLRVAPAKQVIASIEAWPLVAPPLSVVPPGTLRPIVGDVVGHDRMLNAGMRLLLYTNEVVVNHSLLDVEHLTEVPKEDARSELADRVAALATIRPFVEDGSIQFTQRKDFAIGRHPSHILRFFDLMDRVPCDQWDPFEFNSKFEFTREEYTEILGSTVIAVERGKGTPLALTKNEELAFQAAFSGFSIDERPVGLRKLASLRLPDYLTDVRGLMALRSNSDVLAEFRTALAEAMAAVAIIPETDDAVREAEGIFADVLSSRLEDVRRESTQSILRKVAGPIGIKRLAFAGIGFLGGIGAATITGAAPIAPVMGAAGSVLTSGIDVAQEAVMAAKVRRDSRAVWEVVMSFRPEVQ
jgi:hypothetical protein